MPVLLVPDNQAGLCRRPPANQHGSGPFTNVDLTDRQHSTCGASQFSRSSPLTWVPDQGANAAKATPAPTTKKHCTQPTDNTISKLWTGRPYDLPPWFLLNRRDLYDTVNGARQFVRFGITVDKKVSVRSLQHAQAYLNGTIIEGTLDVLPFPRIFPSALYFFSLFFFLFIFRPTP
mgnify:CR=1 FL=1